MFTGCVAVHRTVGQLSLSSLGDINKLLELNAVLLFAAKENVVLGRRITGESVAMAGYVRCCAGN